MPSNKYKLAASFKKEVNKLVQSTDLKKDFGCCGLCNALKGDNSVSYEVIAGMTVAEDFGRCGQFTNTRRDFLMLLYAMTIKDVMRFIK